jgi:hypothetical protein
MRRLIKIHKPNTPTGYELLEIDTKQLSEAHLKRFDEIIAKLKRLCDEHDREQKRNAEQASKEHKALLERLPEKLKKRSEAGFAGDDEIEDALLRIIVSDAGYDWDAGLDKNLQMTKIKKLTDEEFDRLQDEGSRAPEGAEVSPMTVWVDGGEDEPAEPCRRVFLVRWQVAGITVNAIVPISPDSELVKPVKRAKKAKA